MIAKALNFCNLFYAKYIGDEQERNLSYPGEKAMRKPILILILLLFLYACKEQTGKAKDWRGIPGPEKVEVLAPDIDEQEKKLRQQGFHTMRNKKGDSTYLMQQYFLVLLKMEEKTAMDSSALAGFQEQNKEYLDKMEREERIRLAGLLADEGAIREIIIFKTPTRETADSLARLHPMVKEGILKAEVHPWWLVKEGTPD